MRDEPELRELSDGQTADVVVIGAGIIGVATALELRLAGHDVLLLDRQGIATEASAGNAGALAFSDILPLASPGITRQVPRWLIDPLGPLAVRPTYVPQLAPWLWHFWRASRAKPFALATQAQSALMSLAASSMRHLLARAGLERFLRDGGNLHLYETHRAWRRSLAGWDLRAAHGISFSHHHEHGAMLAMQPGLAPVFAVATFVPAWQTVTDPFLMTRALAIFFRGLGGVLGRCEVRALRPSADAIDVVHANSRTTRGRHVVVCAGAWSHRIAHSLSDHFPLETERGYNTTLPAAFDLRRQLTFPDHGFVITPIGAGVRVGGGVEFAGLGAAPRFERANAMLAKAKRFLPGLSMDGKTQWMGCRPSLPDSLPAIGRSAAHERVIYAFGHGHLGLTQSAATATLVRELIEGRSPCLDLSPFAPNRFAPGAQTSKSYR